MALSDRTNARRQTKFRKRQASKLEQLNRLLTEILNRVQ